MFLNVIILGALLICFLQADIVKLEHKMTNLPITHNTRKLKNCHDNFYTLKLGVGKPAQLFDFLVDTGSSQMWLALLNETGMGFNSSES